MRIGLLFNLDNKTVLDYLEADDKEKVKDACPENCAPAVNTLMLSLLKEGHFLRIFTLAKTEFTIKTNQLEIIAVQPPDNYFVKYSLGCFVEAWRIKQVLLFNSSDLDVIHAHWTYAYAYASTALARRIPVFVTVRDWAPYIWKIMPAKDKVYWSFRVLMNEIVMRNKHIRLVANSTYTAARIKKKLGKDVPIVPNSIKDEFVKEEAHVNPDIFTILCISSSNDRRKNVIALLKAYQLFRKKRKDSKLQIIGSQFYMNAPKIKEWEKAGLVDGVEMLGEKPHAELRNYLDMATVFVSPSLEETFGNTLLESIVRRVPVIGGEKSGAVPYVLHQGKAGLLCDVSNPDEIAKTIEYAYMHPKEMETLVEEAFRIVTVEYNERTVCNRHLQLYNAESLF